MVDMRIGVSRPLEEALVKAGDPVPDPVPVKGLIDTGATASVIQPAAAQQLGLKPIGVVNVSTASSSSVQCPQYVARLVFPNNVLVEVTVIEAPLTGQQIQCLIGRDALSHGVLIYNGYMNQFTLSF